MTPCLIVYTAYRQMRVHLPVFLKQNNSNTEQSMKKYIVLMNSLGPSDAYMRQ